MNLASHKYCCAVYVLNEPNVLKFVYSFAAGTRLRSGVGSGGLSGLAIFIKCRASPTLWRGSNVAGGH